MAQPQPYDAQDLKRRMHGAVESLRHDFGGLRTGRASSSLLEPIQVDAYGANMPISQVASISVPEARMLQISVWDRGLVVAVEKAICIEAFDNVPQVGVGVADASPSSQYTRAFGLM